MRALRRYQPKFDDLIEQPQRAMYLQTIRHRLLAQLAFTRQQREAAQFRQIMTLHRGQAQALSRNGTSRFTLTFPDVDYPRL